MTNETVFTLEATPIKFGPGASADAGWELKRLGCSRVMVVSDPGVVEAGITGRIVEAIEAAGIEAVVFDRARVEPTAESLQEAADFAVDGDFDGFVGVGGGSSLDTAKVADLVATHPAPIMDYVNAPVGEGKKPPGPLKPLLAIPTTAGTGSEATTVAVLDVPDQRTKSGISHRYLRPHQGIVDPELLRGVPAEVTSSCGLDVVCHAVESFVSKPYDSRERPESPDDRPPYQGANPVSDVWSAKALEYGGRYLRRAVQDADDLEARGAMMLAASLAGIGFGSAGVHIPHACAYPIASLKHEYAPPGYPDDHPFVPHGWSVDRHRAGRVPLHLRGRPGEAPPRGRADRGQGAAGRGREHAARRADRADARRRRAQRRARARLRRRRRRRAGRGRGQAAAAAGRLAARALGERPRRDHPQLYGELAGEPRGRITSERTLNTASSRSMRASGCLTPSKCPSPR